MDRGGSAPRCARGIAIVGVVFVVALIGAACSSSPDPEPAQPDERSEVTPSFSPTPAPAPTSAPGAVPAEPQQEARFQGGVFRVGPFLREQLIGSNWHPGCPVGVDVLRHVEVSYWDFKGHVRSGPLIVHEMEARDVLWVFQRLFRAEFQIHRIKLPPAFRPPTPADYWNSTRNRTAGFNCRPATGNPGSLSHHSYGWAIDVNPLQNPYVTSDGSVLRRAAKPYTDRSLGEPGMIEPGDVVVRSFARIGWEWGGDWVTLKDYMHFSLTGR